jgi:hypothetical protein
MQRYPPRGRSTRRFSSKAESSPEPDMWMSRNEPGGVDVSQDDTGHRRMHANNIFPKRISALPTELLQLIAQILVDGDKHRRCSRFNRTCRTSYQATVGTLWRTATVRTGARVCKMLKDQRWKDFISGAGIKHCRYVSVFAVRWGID